MWGILLWSVFSVGFGLELWLPPSASVLAMHDIVINESAAGSELLQPSLFHTGVQSSYLQLFSQAELPSYYLFAGHSFSAINVGLGVSQFGENLCKEWKGQLSLQKEFSNIAIGVHQQVVTQMLEGSKNYSAYIASAGISWRIAKFTSALSFLNCSSSMWHGVALPVSLRWQAEYSPLKGYCIYTACYKETDCDTQVIVGNTVQLNPALQALISYSTDPAGFSGGLIIRKNQFSVEVAVQQHPELNTTQAVTIGYCPSW